MKTNDNLQKIKLTLEQIRQSSYSEVSSEILDEIINIQFDNQEADRRVAGRNATHQAIKRYISSAS